MIVMRRLMPVAGYLLIAVGLISWVTPIPGGTLLIASGLTLLICTSQAAANLIAGCRSRFGMFDRLIGFVEQHAPKFMQDALVRTRPATRSVLGENRGLGRDADV